MTTINCIENCTYEKNGVCTLNHATPISNISINHTGCAYFIPKDLNSNKKKASKN